LVVIEERIRCRVTTTSCSEKERKRELIEKYFGVRERDVAELLFFFLSFFWCICGGNYEYSTVLEKVL
jgi:hypothetical protein